MNRVRTRVEMHRERTPQVHQVVGELPDHQVPPAVALILGRSKTVIYLAIIIIVHLIWLVVSSVESFRLLGATAQGI